MEKDLDNSEVQNSSCEKDSESDKSFVGKVKSIITNTPLSKWFWRHDDKRSTVRRRDEVFEDDEMCEMQPPLKRVKLPAENDGSNYNVLFDKTSNIHITNNARNNVSKSKFNNFHEPVAGPSGIKSRKLTDSGTTISVNSARNTYNSSELLNGLKDSDSEESTSGYSSVPRIDSKEQVCGSQESSKQTSPLQSSPNNSRSLFHASKVSTNRSLFADRSLSPNMNTSLSSRRPSFNASTFGSPNFVDKTIATKKIINSPFYSGRTTYGGASAYSRSLGRSKQDLKSSLRTPMQINPVNKSADSDSLVLGKTARRILDTLEQYSSPVNDAKKIPLVSKTQKDGLLTKYTGANPYIIRQSSASNKELQVPSVSDLLKMKQRIRLQDSTEIVKQIAASSKSNLNTEFYKINTDENEKERHTGKVKTRVTAPLRHKHFSKDLGKDTACEINLKPVALPITTLPKFDLNLPVPSAAAKTSESSAIPMEQVETPLLLSQPQSLYKEVETEKNVQVEKQTTTTTVIEYTFSDPLVIAENIKTLVPINNFKFSEPLCKKPLTDFSPNVMLNFKMPENKPCTLIPVKNKTVEKSPEKSVLLKTGSVMDILGKKDDPLMDKFKPGQGTWECSACLIRNQPDKEKCVACENPKSVSPKQSQKKEDFGSLYKMSSDKWECSSCMVRNNNADSKCIACGTSKTNLIVPMNTSINSGGTSSGFGDKFKLSSDTWECSVCMIRNKSELTKCAACEAPNPKVPTVVKTPSFDNFKPSANSWECTTCLIRNKEEVTKCVACETPKSGLKSNSTGFGSAFKVKDDEWECDACMVRNKMSNITCQCCGSAKPGNSESSLETKSDQSSISTFNFGIDKTSSNAFSFGIPTTAERSLPKGETNASSIFGENAKPAAVASTSFSFGIPAPAQNKPDVSKSTTVATGETPVLQNSNPLLKPNEKLPEKVDTAPSGFKFNVPTSTPMSNQTKPPSTDKRDTATTVSTNSISSIPTFNFKPASANGEINKTSTFDIKLNFTTSNTSVTSVPTISNSNMFSFGTKPTATATPLPSISTTQSGQPVPPKPVFKFGSSSHLSSDTSIAPFGAVSSVNSTATANGFVTTTKATFGTTNTKTFEAPMKTQSSEVKSSFTFGTSSATGEPVSKAPVFSFGAPSLPVPTTTAPAKAAGFNFGSTITPSFNFTGGATEPNFNPPTGNIFGGASSSAAGKNGTFNFGSMASNSNQKAGFSFGAVNNTSVAPATQSGFSFGAATAPAQPSGGFNFTGAPPTFNAAAKPSFNFTDGNVTAFTAQPTTDGGLAVPRKIKRAVRRTQR